MSFDFGAACKAFLGDAAALFNICGFVQSDGRIHPLDTDSKVLATLFEMEVKGKLQALADAHGFRLETPSEQNYYPDFTLTRDGPDGTIVRLAVDVKTTYCEADRDVLKFTLGSYTGCINPARETKNILYPFSTYAEHWVIGFVYERIALAPGTRRLYQARELDQVPRPIRNVRLFVQEKWRIAGDKPGSGNTCNIGSVEGPLRHFEEGRGVFASNEEFLAYWRNYGANGERRFTSLSGFQAWCREAAPHQVPASVIEQVRRAPHQLGLF